LKGEKKNTRDNRYSLCLKRERLKERRTPYKKGTKSWLVRGKLDIGGELIPIAKKEKVASQTRVGEH